MILRALQRLGAALAAALILGPLLVPGAELLGALIHDPAALADALPGSRRGLLLADSLLFAAAVTLLSLLVAIPAARALLAVAGRSGRWLRALVTAAVAVPPYLHALAWVAVAQQLGNGAPPAGWWPALWVETLARLPLATLFALAGLAAVSPELLEAGHLYRPPAAVFRRIALPLAAPALRAGAALAFVLTLNDFAVPALFQLPSYTLEVFAEFGASGMAARSWLVALPLLLCSAAAVLLLVGALREAPLGFASAGPPDGDQPSAVSLGAMTLLGAAIVVPLLATGAAALQAPAAAPWLADLGYTLLLAAVVGLLTLVLGAPLAGALQQRRGLLLTVAVAGLALPPSLMATGAIALGTRPPLAPLYGTLWFSAFGHLPRLLPVAVLLLAAFHARCDPLPLEAAVLFRGEGAATWLQIRLPLLAPGLAVAFALVFALLLGDVEAGLLLDPPGYASAGNRIYGYLHYGETGQVARLALAVAAAAGSAGLLLSAALRRWQNGEERTGA